MYFDESEEQEEGRSPPDELEGPELLLYSRGAPSNREELISQLPERRVADRLIMRYFSCMSPSQRKYHSSACSCSCSKLTENRYRAPPNIYQNS